MDSFLRSYENKTLLTVQLKSEMCLDVVRGMVYISKKGVIHRDLAVRNLLLTSSNSVKVSDFGMSRENNYYSSSSKVIPYRWSALEVVNGGNNSVASDVWSFGVWT